MAKLTLAVVAALISVCIATPASYIIHKLDHDLRYQYAIDSAGESHLVDLWMSVDDLSKATRFQPELTNEYHLFTRANPSLSQPILFGNDAQLATTNFDGSKRTAVLFHSWLGNALSDSNMVLLPAFLAAEDINVIIIDWSAGANSINYRTVIENTITSAAAVARFIDWISQASGSSLTQFHLVGHGFGGHQAGIVGRNLGGNIGYITALNPALVGWTAHPDHFSPNDGVYTEAIHTNYLLGFPGDLAQVDFYPNGGISMPGCVSSPTCDDARSYFYFAESLLTGGFTGTRCLNYYAAMLSLCNVPGTPAGELQMGGLKPKTESPNKGVYWLETNASPPFSMG